MNKLLRVVAPCIVVCLFAPMESAMIPSRNPAPAPKILLTVTTDRKRYDADDNILVLINFKGDPQSKIQFSSAGGSGVHFHFLLDPIGRKGSIICHPVWRLQFQEWAEKRGEGDAHWLREIESGISHQVAIHLPMLRELPEGQYKMRIGYTRQHRDELAELVEQTLGQKVAIDGLATELVKGGWDGALLSDPVIITVGPEKGKK